MLVEDTTLCVLREEFVSSISLMDLRLNVQVVDEKPLCLEDRLARKSHYRIFHARPLLSSRMGN